MPLHITGYDPVYSQPATPPGEQTHVETPKVVGGIPKGYYEDSYWSHKETPLAQKAVASTQSSWYDWLTKGATRLMETLSGSVAAAATQTIETTQSWKSELYRKLEGLGAEHYVKGLEDLSVSLWNTLSYTETQFKDPAIAQVQIPEQNVNDTPNLFGGRTITRGEHYELRRFTQDLSDLAQNLQQLVDTYGCEALMVALLKAMAKDRRNILQMHRDRVDYLSKKRDIDADLRMKASQELIEKVEANRWYDWFRDAMLHTSLAFVTLTLAQKGTPGGWLAPLVAVTGASLLNFALGHPLEAALAKMSSTLLGSGNAASQAAHKSGWTTAVQLALTYMATTIGLRTTSGSALQNTAVTTLSALPTIGNALVTLRKAQLQQETNHIQGEIEYHADKLRGSESAITHQLKELSTDYLNYLRNWKDALQSLLRAGQITRTILRN